MRILTEPKNALVRQYVYLMDLDGVSLEFEPAALQYIAKKAIERKSGARGLRAIIETLLMDTMFELPSRNDVQSCIITEQCVLGNEKPKLIASEGKPRKSRKKNNEKKALASPPSESSVS